MRYIQLSYIICEQDFVGSTLAYLEGAFSRAIFLWQRSIVTETLAMYLRSHTSTKSLKENLSKNLCLRILSHNLCCSVHTNDKKAEGVCRIPHIS